MTILKVINCRMASLIYALFFLIVVVAFVDGVLIEKIGFDRLETIYFSCLLFLLAIFVLLSRVSLVIALYMTLVSAIIFGASFLDGSVSRLSGDIRFFMRSYVLGMFFFICVMRYGQRIYSVRSFFYAQWLLIAILIFSHFLFGFGGVTGGHGKIRPIYTSFFKEGNVVVFFLIISWFYIYSHVRKYKKFASTVATFILSALMSSKAGILSMLLLIIFHYISCYKEANGNNARIVNISIIFVTLVFILSFEYILDLLSMISVYIFPDGDVIASRMQGANLLTVLTSYRDVRVIELFNDIGGYSVSEFLFGIGFKKVVSLGSFIESDPFDIFQGYGVVGLSAYYVPIFALLFAIKKDRVVRCFDFKYYIFALGVLYCALFVSTVTGHILLTPMSVLLLGFVFGYFMWIRRKLVGGDGVSS